MSASVSVFYKIPDGFINRNRSSANTANFVYREIYREPTIRSFIREKVNENTMDLYYLTKQQHLLRCPDGHNLHWVHDMFSIDLIIHDVERDVAHMVARQQQALVKGKCAETSTNKEKLFVLVGDELDEANKENNCAVVEKVCSSSRSYKITHNPVVKTAVCKKVTINKTCCI